MDFGTLVAGVRQIGNPGQRQFVRQALRLGAEHALRALTGFRRMSTVASPVGSRAREESPDSMTSRTSRRRLLVPFSFTKNIE